MDKASEAIKYLLRVMFSYRTGHMTQQEFFKWIDALEDEMLQNDKPKN